MANISLERPSKTVAQVISGGNLGTAGSSFYIKTLRATFDSFSPLIETTGDGDTAVTHENNCFLYQNFNLRGWMVANQAIGLSSIAAADPEIAITFALGANRELNSTIIVERMLVDWDKQSPVGVGIAILGKATDVAPSEDAI